MMLSAHHLANLLERGQATEENDPFVVVPCPDLNSLRNSSNASVDLRLGNWFLTLRDNRVSELSASNPEAEWQEARLSKAHYVGFGDRFVLQPGGFALAATLEWIRLPANCGAYVVGRSGWGRAGLIIATAVGVHPHFSGCLTLELSNVGSIPIGLHPGAAVCQIFVHHVSSEAQENATEKKSKFSGSRRPKLGKIQLDSVADHLVHRHDRQTPLPGIT